MTSAREETNRLAELLRREHHSLAEFLVALAAFDRERRWSQLGYNSLFSFLVRELALSKGAAFYRNRAAVLIQKHPEIIEPLRDGRLCLSSVAELSNVLTGENLPEVLPRFFHLSRAEAKEVTAELKPDPAPPLRTVITAPSTAEPVLAHAGFPENLDRARPAVPAAPAPTPTPASAVPAPAAPMPPLAQQPPKRAAIEPLTADLRRLHVTVTRRLLDKLSAARDALSHSHPGASEDEILEVGLDLIIQRHAKRRGIGAKPRKATRAPGDGPPAAPSRAMQCAAPAPIPTPSFARRSRHVPAAVEREVWERDQGRCQYPIDGGGICGATHQIQFDHIPGFALGAGHTAAELRLLCRPHQDVHARRLYGDALMDRYTGPKGNGCSEPAAPWGAGSTPARGPAAGRRPRRGGDPARGGASRGPGARARPCRG